MPKYEVTAPDGSKWRVSAPEGATQEQVLGYAREQIAASQSGQPTKARYSLADMESALVNAHNAGDNEAARRLADAIVERRKAEGVQGQQARTMDVRMPDGTIVKNVPEGTTQRELLERLRAGGHEQVARFKTPDGRVARFAVPAGTTPEQAQAMAEQGLLQIPTTEPSLLDHAKQTAGNVLAGAVRGAGSIGATILSPWDKARDLIAGDRKTGPSRNDERRQAMDDALASLGAKTDSLAYRGGKLGAEIAGTMGVGGAAANGLRAVAPALTAAPAAANVLRAIETAGTQGGGLLSRSAGAAANGLLSAGFVDPSEAKGGAVVGAATPGLLWALGKAASPLAPATATKELAGKAVRQYGIPLGIADMSDNAATKAVRAILNDAPVIGSIGEGQRRAVQTGFNKAVGGSFGAPEAKLTPEVMDAAKKRLGAEFDRIWNNNALVMDGPMVEKLQELQTVAQKMPAQEGGALQREVQDLLSKVSTDANGNAVIPGDVANRFQSYLRRRAEGAGGMRNELNDLRQAIIGAFNRSVTPADAAALSANRSAYKAFKTVEPLMQSAEVGVGGRVAGDVPAGLLSNAVLKSYGNASGTQLGDLAQIGSHFVVDRVPKTGGGTRAAIQNAMVGGAVGVGAWHNPVAAGIGSVGGAGLEWLLGSPMAGRLVARAANAPPGTFSAPFARALPVAVSPPVGLLDALQP